MTIEISTAKARGRPSAVSLSVSGSSSVAKTIAKKSGTVTTRICQSAKITTAASARTTRMRHENPAASSSLGGIAGRVGLEAGALDSSTEVKH